MAGKLRFIAQDLTIITEKFDVKDICLTDHLGNQYIIDVSGALKLKYTPSGGNSEEYTLAGLSNWIKDLFKVQPDNTPTLPKSFIHTSDITSWWNNAFNNFTSTQSYKDKNYTEYKKEALHLIARDLLKCIRGQECEPACDKEKNIDENSITIENFVKEIQESYGLRFLSYNDINNQWNNESKQSIYKNSREMVTVIPKADYQEKQFSYDPRKFYILFTQTIIKINDLADIIGDVLKEEYQKEVIKPIDNPFARLDGSNIEKDDGLVSELMSYHTAQVFDFLSALDIQYNVFGTEG
ncbi:Hypothetical protein CINCED_3A018471 [Cinara cedri]|uniref:Uncharacterized protein n=1 Tax=Cinara cedri TaxID=506608 RepID=A0A5E4M9E6_9HEMI|nr:Hypothetical protein CINCED_3A018471 [Cinara cedri]